ncbi:HAMP domain-containing protein [Aristophania vespae]|uniref:histidine kinase n=1 Tax=Aristophania vespae TaxID=2697033 RepID=A0A6P1NEP7_9PROT|nr:HAMP domain-containing sensor histidine kinase [Aristophania vespae]QHI95918.1 HAMP domain-containing protein [Aristophania vespae]UMM63650.1 Adaptive-response sensory-kinase SasA [Aristophania vespae]
MSRHNPFLTITFRFTVALTGVLILGMCLQLVVIYEQIKSYEHVNSRGILRRTAELLSQEAPHELEVKVRDRSTNELRVSLNGAGLFDIDERYIVGDIHQWPKGLLPVNKIQTLSFRLRDGTVSSMRVLVVRVKGLDGRHDRYLVLAHTYMMASHFHQIIIHIALFSMLPILLFALVAGYLLSQKILNRVELTHHAIERIMKGNLQERLPIGRERDGLERVAGSVNHMLDRLERLMMAIRDVGNDIAHDIRTPLARLQARMNRIAKLPLSPTPQEIEKFNKAVDRCRGDIEQCFTVIKALLRIAEIENNLRKEGFSTFDVVSLIIDLADLYEPMAETKNVSLSVLLLVKERQIFADMHLLSEVVANLVDNAIKFTEPGGSVSIAVGEDAKRQLWIEVRDTGVGIAENEREAVLNRFYRTDKTRMVPGHGLGLSLVMPIIELHNATLDINYNVYNENAKGSIFRVLFPACSS